MRSSCAQNRPDARCIETFHCGRCAGEVCGGVVVGPWQRAITDAVAVHIFVARKSAEAVEIFFAQNFSARDWLFWIFKRISHPVVHAKIEVGHDKNKDWNFSASSKASIAMLKHSSGEMESA